MVLGPLSTISSIIGAGGSLLGGKAASDGADNAADYTKNIMSWLKDVSNDNFKGSREEIGKTRHKVLGESRDLHSRSHRTARETRDANTDILTGSRDRSIADVQGAHRAGMRDIRTNRRQNIGDINDTEGANLGQISRTRRQNLRTARGQLGASLGYFEPAIGAGNNALSAFSDMLGLSQGGYNMALTPATQYLMEQGRNTVEGGAAGSGGLYSGETLAELEKMRTGLASQDYQTQMAQLMSLVGVGQNAGGNAATLRSGFTDDAAAYRTNAQNAGINVRDTATAGRTGVRDDATQARLGLRDDTTGDMNALRQFYDPALVGVNDTYANRANTADVNFANMNTNAWNNQLRDTLGARQFMQNMKLQAGTSLAPTAAGMIAGKGAAQASGIIGATNALTGGIGNYAYSQGMQQGGAVPVGMPGGATPTATGAPWSATPWLQQQQLPQPPAGGNWTGALY